MGIGGEVVELGQGIRPQIVWLLIPHFVLRSLEVVRHADGLSLVSLPKV